MPQSRYLNIQIDGQPVDIDAPEDLPLSISYKLEDVEDFQKKRSAEAFDITVPATVGNDAIANTFHNPGIEDLTDGAIYRGARRCVIEAGGYELLVGKAFLQDAEHTNCPLSYTYDLYGGNADWMIDLKETTLFDVLKHVQFPFTKQAIIDSWAYDGTSESLPYVFAPVRYREPMEKMTVAGVEVNDRNMVPTYMKPALSPYWILYWAFKSVGYRIESAFFDTAYFRRAVMPWTWGNFLYSEGTRLDNLKFLAKSSEQISLLHTDHMDFADFKVTNDSTIGAYDNNDTYSYISANKEMRWTYKPAFNYGRLEAHFYLPVALDLTCTDGSEIEVFAIWYHNGVQIARPSDKIAECISDKLFNLRKDYNGIAEDWMAVEVEPGDTVSCKIFVYMQDTNFGRATLRGSVDGFQMEYFRSVIGSTINFENYSSLKKYKFLDLLRGIIDTFNLVPQTDAVAKVVYIEPAHPYATGHDLTTTFEGYFNGDHLDWSDKQDLSKKSKLTNFNDSERELLFRFRDDSNDGILKVVQDRYVNKVALGKYVFPDRFKAGKKDIENRFFSPVMHYEVDQWKGLGSVAGESPQMICMIPENISNTSREEAQNTFSPKLAWYKGLVSDVGWVFDSAVLASFPFMFAVNYKTGGESDPILSYSDELIGKTGSLVVGKGLLRRFYLQRMAIMRNGQYYATHFRLDNLDVSNFLHREHIICRGQRWELVEINGYQPLKEESTACFLRKWAPVTQADSTSTFPSPAAVEGSATTNAFDLKYTPLKCLPSDIPTT